MRNLYILEQLKIKINWIINIISPNALKDTTKLKNV